MKSTLYDYLNIAMSDRVNEIFYLFAFVFNLIEDR